MIFICQKLNNKWQEAHIGVGYFNSPKNLLKRAGSNMVNIGLKNNNSTTSTLTAPITATMVTTNASKRNEQSDRKTIFSSRNIFTQHFMHIKTKSPTLAS